MKTVDTDFLFTFTADHEEPCCGWCDKQDKCDGRYVRCGPYYSWSAYSRTVRVGDMSPYELDIMEQCTEL